MDRLHALLLLREKGSLIRAAEGDAVRQSQMSRYLKDLASYFELELVERAGKSLKLTAAGEELAGVVQRYFGELSSFQNRAQNLPRTVVIAGESNLLASIITPLIGRLSRPSKECHFELRGLGADQIIEGLHEQKISLGILSQALVPKSLRSMVLMEQRYGIIIPDRLVPSRGMLTSKRALLECPHALDGSDVQLAMGLSQITKKMGGVFKPSLLCSAQDQCIAAVRSGYYASVLPLSSFPSVEGTSTQVVEAPELELLGGKIMTVWNKRHLLVNPHVGPIRDSLKELRER